jgi:hypothetical protein
MTHWFIQVAMIVALAVPAWTAVAADGAPAESRAERRARLEQWCKDNPEKCREAKAKLEQWREQCKAEPEKCRAEMQAGAQQWCTENPEKCRELKAKAEQRREECRADPEKCRAEREALRERRNK